MAKFKSRSPEEKKKTRIKTQNTISNRSDEDNKRVHNNISNAQLKRFENPNERYKCGNATRGKTSWNKGLTGVTTSWLKGINLPQYLKDNLREKHSGRIWVTRNNLEKDRQIWPIELEYYKSIGYKEGRKDLTEEERTKRLFAFRETMSNKSEEERNARIQKRKETMNNKSEEEKQEIVNKRENTKKKNKEGKIYIYNGQSRRWVTEEELPTYIANGYHQKVA